MIRDVVKSDTPGIAKLLKSMGYSTSQSALEAKLENYSQIADTYKVMIDIEDDGINGLMGLQIIDPFHSAGKVGRVTTLVIDQSYRGTRAGRMLVETADQFFIECGCSASEVTGAIMRSNARKIFISLGYTENDRYFIKQLRARI